MAASLPPLFSTGESLSLYIHVPFCAQKCGYCDFYSRATVRGIEEYLNAFEQEVLLYLEHYPQLRTRPVATIFTGGGTPSILSSKQWERLSRLIKENFTILPECEWTIECNPESFTPDKAMTWLASGVNRLSMGVQSLDPKVLKLADRIHSAETVESVLSSEILKQFKRVSCDVIYGLPGQSVEDVESTLNRLLSHDSITHLSAYELTIAEGTPFASLPESSFPDDEFLADYEDAVLNILEDAGFTRYEVSNYAKPGAECQHNIAYWEMHPYLGLGPSAHSFDGKYRFAAVSSLTEYCEMIAQKEFPWSSCDGISPEMFRDEYLFLSLRMAAGLSEERYEKLFGEKLYDGRRITVLEGLEKRGDLIRRDGQVMLTAKGLNLADGVALQLSC